MEKLTYENIRTEMIESKDIHLGITNSIKNIRKAKLESVIFDVKVGKEIYPSIYNRYIRTKEKLKELEIFDSFLDDGLPRAKLEYFIKNLLN